MRDGNENIPTDLFMQTIASVGNFVGTAIGCMAESEGQVESMALDFDQAIQDRLDAINGNRRGPLQATYANTRLYLIAVARWCLAKLEDEG